jgi:hypothetical protein
MGVLAKSQIQAPYFRPIGGFPGAPILKEVKQYHGERRLCVSCTQLDSQRYDARAKKRIPAEWIDWLRKNTTALTALHFNSRVPQELFDAACCQEDLEELRCKWGSYTDLSSLQNLKKLNYLYIGSGAGVSDLAPLAACRSLIVLHIENFKRIEDYSPLAGLEKLEQLVISGPNLGKTPVRDLEFLRDMKSLVSFWCPNTAIRKKYTAAQLENLRYSLPRLHTVNGCVWR